MQHLIIALMCLVAASSVSADWEMVKDESSFSFGTVFNERESEKHKTRSFMATVPCQSNEAGAKAVTVGLI